MIHQLHFLFLKYGNAIVFIMSYLNNIGFPFPGEPILFVAGFILGKQGVPLWGSIAAGTAACFLGGESAFWMGRWVSVKRLKKIHWLHLTAKKFDRMERFFKRYGAKSVFIARFIAFFPPLVPNILAGMAKLPWRIFVFFNLTGSVVYATLYILIGCFFGKEWKWIKVWLGPTGVYLIIQGIVLVVLVVVFRHFIYRLWVRSYFGKRKRK